MHFGGARGSQDRPGYPRGRSCARPAPTPRQRPRPSGPSGKHPPHRGGGKSRLSYPEARSLELDGSRRGPFCRARALLQGVKRARCPCPGAGGRRRCRTHNYSGSPIYLSRVAGSLLLPPTGGETRLLAHAPESPVFPPAPASPTGSAASGGEIGHTPPPIALCSAAPLLRCVPAAPPGAETAAVAATV